MPESSTQEFLEIEDIKEGVVILKDKSLRGILMVSSINFALKSEEEQSAIVFSFQSFLNSLDFSCQIVIQSRKLNITSYLDDLKDLEEKQVNELMKIQTTAYREFIAEIVKGQTIMTKNFYIVIPYTLMEALGIRAVKRRFPLPKIFKGGKKESAIKEADFERCKTQLWQRMEFLAMGLRRCGLESVPLTTPELIELFWSINHPEEAEIGYYPEILPELLK